MKRLIIALSLTVCQLATVFGQQMTVTVDSIGQLGQQLPDSVRYTMSNLKICGPLNGSDLRVIQLITNRLKAKKNNEVVLTELDLSEATIVEGKGTFRTAANMLPAAMFLNCKALERVVMPKTTPGISRSCFSGCVSLKEVIIPDESTVINDYAFNGCVSLTNVKIPISLTTVGKHAFDGCKSITSIEIPDAVTSIGANAFTNCSSLERVTINGNLTRIENATFAGCERIKAIDRKSVV